jgi:uncharacterized protein YkwD
MKYRVLAGLAALGLSLAGCLEEESDDEGAAESSGVDVQTYPNGHPLLTDTTNSKQLAVEEDLLRLTNEYRHARGLSTLLPHPVAQQEARAVARHMRVHGFVGHDNPEGDGPGERLWQTGVPYLAFGENLAWGWYSAAEAFQFWVQSPPHRENLENPSWTHAGMGFWSGGSSWRTYYAQEFLMLSR